MKPLIAVEAFGKAPNLACQMDNPPNGKLDN